MFFPSCLDSDPQQTEMSDFQSCLHKKRGKMGAATIKCCCDFATVWSLSQIRELKKLLGGNAQSLIESRLILFGTFFGINAQFFSKSAAIKIISAFLWKYCHHCSGNETNKTHPNDY